MALEEQRLELKNQIAYYQQELAHLGELPAKSLLGVMQDSEKLLLSLIASLHEQLSDLSVYPHASANGFVL